MRRSALSRSLRRGPPDAKNDVTGIRPASCDRRQATSIPRPPAEKSQSQPPELADVIQRILEMWKEKRWICGLDVASTGRAASIELRKSFSKSSPEVRAKTCKPWTHAVELNATQITFFYCFPESHWFALNIALSTNSGKMWFSAHEPSWDLCYFCPNWPNKGRGQNPQQKKKTAYLLRMSPEKEKDTFHSAALLESIFIFGGEHTLIPPHLSSVEIQLLPTCPSNGGVRKLSKCYEDFSFLASQIQTKYHVFKNCSELKDSPVEVSRTAIKYSCDTIIIELYVNIGYRKHNMILRKACKSHCGIGRVVKELVFSTERAWF